MTGQEFVGEDWQSKLKRLVPKASGFQDWGRGTGDSWVYETPKVCLGKMVEDFKHHRDILSWGKFLAFWGLVWQRRGGSQSPLCEARYGGSKEFAVERRAKEEKKMGRTTDYQRLWNFRVFPPKWFFLTVKLDHWVGIGGWWARLLFCDYLLWLRLE